MRRILLLVCTIMFITATGGAQDYGTMYNRTPLPPNTAALFKPWDKPIGTFTGIPPINIPLYTLEGNGFAVPISLSYSAGGIKVEEIASSVGLGWNLSVGGMVSRIKNGRADDYQGGQWLSTYKPSHFSGTPTQLDGVVNGSDDLEPDIFMYNVNGMTGTFVVDETEKIVILQQSSDVKIVPWIYPYLGSPFLGGFFITDEQGYTYRFGVYDYNMTEAYISGWHLDEIRDMNGRLVATFQYQSAQHSYKTWTSAFTTSLFGSNNWSGCTPSDYAGGEYQSLQSTYEHHLSKIYMGNDTVVFQLGSRMDLVGSYRVDRMEVKNKNNGVRKFNFNYDYFMTPWYTPSTEDLNERNMRLRLKSISQQPSTGVDSLTHSFTYNTDPALPERMSKAVDYWGYFNGAYGNASLVPNGIYSTVATMVGVNGQGERRTNHDYTGSGTLTRITFPTGGYRQFEYEGNQILYALPYYPDDLYPDINDHTGREFEGHTFSNPNPLVQPAYQHTFTINSLNGSAFFNFWIDGWATSFRVKIIKTSNGAILADLDDEYEGHPQLPNGQYRIEVYYNTGVLFGLYADWQELNTLYYNTPRDVGGLRIKTIDDYDPVTNKHHYTRYKYYYPTDTTATSGTLVSKPEVLFKANCPEKNCDLTRISSTSNYPLSTEGGSYVIYTRVRVIEDGNGYTDRVYNMAGDYEYPLEFPAMPSVNRSYARGQLLSTRYYNQAGSLIRFDTTAYLSPEESWIPNAIGIRVAVHDLTVPFPRRIYCTSARNFLKAVECRPKFERTVWYSPQGSLTTETSYLYYDSLGKKHPQKISTKQSDGSTKDIYYSYSFNPHTAFRLPLSAAEKTMKDSLRARNYLGSLEEVIYNKKGSDSVFTAGLKTTFGYFYTTKRYPASVKRFTTLSDSTMMNFSVYDTVGNVQEQYLTNNTKEVYLYGYNNKYVVAKITGSDYSTVSGIAFNNGILQNPADDATLRTELNKIRTALAGSRAQVTTYTYKPLTGVTSITDVNNKTVYYEYDTHGRLIRIRDHQNNILKKFSYSITQSSF